MRYKDRLKSALEIAGQDRKALAEALGISVQAIGQVLTGSTSALTAENNAKAARFLEVDPYWLATGEGSARPPFMKERAGLSAEAVEHASQYDKLTAPEKRLWRTLVMAAKSGVPDHEVEEKTPATRTKPATHADQVLKSAPRPPTPVKRTHKKTG
jgi:transcriptional regulator with XRE-family HTH domain